MTAKVKRRSAAELAAEIDAIEERAFAAGADGPPCDDGCENCGSRTTGFFYEGHALCCECMGMLCSWFLEGGMREEPAMFGWVLRP